MLAWYSSRKPWWGRCLTKPYLTRCKHCNELVMMVKTTREDWRPYLNDPTQKMYHKCDGYRKAMAVVIDVTRS